MNVSIFQSVRWIIKAWLTCAMVSFPLSDPRLLHSEKAGIYPLLDTDDMVMMKKPDWKCVFTYVQAIYRRLKDGP